ncbi:MAG TPA: hypothetical protein VKA84_28020 [Gemmatimonadaceae bacterium]|nr:hypothetical protein [Gemmatimonadaceae bacterium]
MHSLALATTLALAAANPVSAQDELLRADSLFRNGRVFAAESLYYLAARREPRNPATRLALGRYLAARGALKVGAVLMEEARFFGGDPDAVARELAPVYARIGDYRALTGLPAGVLTSAERARAEWLRMNPPSHAGPDSLAVAYVPGEGEGEGLGRVTIVIAGDTAEAVIDPSVFGLVLDTAWLRRKELRHFPGGGGASARGEVGVTPLARMGALTLTNTATRFLPTGGRRRARIGLDVLGNFAATFDPSASRIFLRRNGAFDDEAPGTHIATLTLPTGVWLITDQVTPLSSESGRAQLRGRRWTVNPKRGEIVVGG